MEINSFDDEELPINATERIALYTAKLSKEYNVLAMTIDKAEKGKKETVLIKNRVAENQQNNEQKISINKNKDKKIDNINFIKPIVKIV